MGSILTDARNYFDTHRASSSVILSIALHIVAIIGVKVYNLNKHEAPPVVEEHYVDFQLQEFEEPPQIVQDIKQVEVKPDVKDDPAPPDPTPTAAHEMQDQSSDVAGLQKEAPKQEPPKPQVVSNANVTDVPYYKVKPKYPKEALAQGIEGHVMLQIDIQEDGSVENLKVLGGEKLSVFETEARRAVSKYKYKPFIDDSGHPMKKLAHLVRVEFKLVDATN